MDTTQLNTFYFSDVIFRISIYLKIRILGPEIKAHAPRMANT